MTAANFHRFESSRSHDPALLGRPEDETAALPLSEPLSEPVVHDDAGYRQMLMQSPESIVLIGKGKVVFANPAAVRLLGGSNAEQLCGGDACSLLGLDDGAAGLAGADETGKAMPPQRLASRTRGLDGCGKNIELFLAPCPIDATADHLVMLHALADDAAGNTARHDHYLQRVTDVLPAIIAYIDHQGCCRFVNAAYEEWFGQARETMLGRPLQEALGPLYGRIQPHIERALRGERISYEVKLSFPKGNRKVIMIYTPDQDAAGTRGFSVMAIDITDHRHGSLKLFEQDMQFRRITDAIPLFIAQCDKQYRIRFVNKSYAERLGLRPEDTVGKCLSDIIGEDAFARFRQYVDAALQGNALEEEIKIPFRIGDHYMHMTYVPERDDRGRVHGLIAAFSDVTRLRRTEEQLLLREQEFKTLVENSPDVISRIDRDMRHLYVNPAIETSFGLKASTYLGKTKAELGLPASMVSAWESAAKAAFATGQEQRFDFEVRADAQPRYFSVRLIPEPAANGDIESLLGITYDMTERTMLEHEREVLLNRERNARIQAETSARARDEFLAIVSHELRAPLNGIQSWAHILENYVKELDGIPMAQRAISGIKTGIAQQVRLIEDLLDVTRMVSGKLSLVKQPLAFLPIVQAAVESVHSLAAAKQIKVVCDYRITDEQISGDADRVQQIIWNLLSNAIKFSPTGGIVRISAEPAGSTVCVTVNDNGIGISPDFLPHLFDRFSQEDTSSTRGHAGLGLGLFLVKHLVELHGGRVSAESAGEGQGTKFSICLPLAGGGAGILATSTDDDAGTAAVTLPSLHGVRALLIDDQQEARDALMTLLTQAGANVFAAASSKEAIGWLESLPAGELPDVLVSDIAMPEEDGYTVLRKLRAWKTANGASPLQRIPALALTAFSQREDRIRALAAGFQMHMSKPVGPEELIVVIATLTQHV